MYANKLINQDGIFKSFFSFKNPHLFSVCVCLHMHTHAIICLSICVLWHACGDWWWLSDVDSLLAGVRHGGRSPYWLSHLPWEDSILKSRKVSLKGSLYGDIYWPAQLKMSGVGVALGEISRVCSIEEPWEIALSAAHPNLVSLDM